MNVLQNLTELYNHLPVDSTYRVVAGGILEHLDEMRDVTIYDVAEITNSSRTTVQRMVQKMGYNSFSDFRYALERAVRQSTYYNRMLPREQSRSTQDILQAVTGQLRGSAALLEQVLSPAAMDELTAELHRAKQIRFYLPMQLYGVYVLQQTLAMDAKQTSYFSLLPDMLEDAEGLCENSIVVIGTIEYAETLDMQALFETAQRRGAVIWLAAGANTRYHSYADRCLMPQDAGPVCWNAALQGMLIALSECYRMTYIDKE